TTLEPCAHASPRGPACSDLLIAAGVASVVAALGDPDPRTDGRGHDRLRAAGIMVEIGLRADDARRSMAGFLTRQAFGRPQVTLKLATSLDGCIALANGESKWITGAPARAHGHIERTRHEAILVGRGTWEADKPTLDVRLDGLENRSPRRLVLSSRHPHPSGADAPPSLSQWAREGAREPKASGKGEGEWGWLPSPQAVTDLENVDHLLVEGGAETAAAFLAADLVDRLLLYRAPILIGGGKRSIGDIGLADLAAAHGRWRLRDRRMLGIDTFEEYERMR
ncbi:MAG: bifunctional diaminohydroxyphosphoribosylaminopyrimidine deaminase/5-amino-6-(5-phosphoribosylamino)uracil reductase RibD, partial [Proteobacteria bacterium]|nr:bifunctional diaminohydroxyphosphoribosylaminopyrimidine deaminase/5-amino-6-(5-phosphoribosylamino)uracil reductase RibD [Pseudomonadota bacterium]